MVVVVVTQVLTSSAQLWTQLIYLPPSHWHFGTCTGRSDRLSCSQVPSEIFVAAAQQLQGLGGANGQDQQGAMIS